jgi:hypothetical protein
MVPLSQLFSLVWLLVVAGCCAAAAGRSHARGSRRCRGKVLGNGKVKRCGADDIRNMPATMKQGECKLREERNGRGEKTVAALGWLAALQESPGNLSVLRPPQGRQVAELETGFDDRRKVRVDGVNYEECKLEGFPVDDAPDSHQHDAAACGDHPKPGGAMPMRLSTAVAGMKRNGHKKHDKTQKGWGDRQWSVALGKHCLKDAGAGRFEWMIFGGVFRALAHHRALCENAARVECLAENTGIFDDFQEKGAARVECLAKNTRDFNDFHERGAARVECLVKKSRGLADFAGCNAWTAAETIKSVLSKPANRYRPHRDAEFSAQAFHPSQNGSTAFPGRTDQPCVPSAVGHYADRLRVGAIHSSGFQGSGV